MLLVRAAVVVVAIVEGTEDGSRCGTSFGGRVATKSLVAVLCSVVRITLDLANATAAGPERGEEGRDPTERFLKLGSGTSARLNNKTLAQRQRQRR